MPLSTIQEPPGRTGSPGGPAGHPRNALLAGLSGDGHAHTLGRHRERYAAPPPPGTGGWAELIDLVDRAGLVGRGGAGFPTAAKMRSLAGGRRRPVVVGNGTEGEPYSAKDRVVLTGLPHLILDGAQWAAAAVGADRVIICIDRAQTEALATLRRAVAERLRAEPAAVVVEIADTPPHYVAGESTALVHWVNGGPAKPTGHPPRAHEKGVDGRPTLVQNVETLAHLTQICREGAEWFRRAGTAEEPGTALFTVSGAVARPSVVEAPIGTPIGEILALAGGPAGPLQALLVGGFFGTWISSDPGPLNAPYSRAGLRPWGAAPGAGVLIALPDHACGLAETARILSWYAAEGAGQCGPCRYGLADLAAEAAGFGGPAAGPVPRPGPRTGHRPVDVAQLRRWADQIEGRGACAHPDGAVRLLRSALGVFRRDLEDHLGGIPCRWAADRPVIHIPRPATGWR